MISVPNRPSKEGFSVESLHEWLSDQDQSTKISADYTIADLVSDLNDLLDQIWSDGIDAMGEDA